MIPILISCSYVVVGTLAIGAVREFTTEWVLPGRELCSGQEQDEADSEEQRVCGSMASRDS